MTDFEILLFDRIEKIKSINEQYDLENNAYISFSGGKDSTILHYLIDLALPNNKIPRVFINTGIEYKDIVNFVRQLSSYDRRFNIIRPTKNIKNSLDEYGYPFKSKEHSLYVSVYQNMGNESKTVRNYLTKNNFNCPKILKYQFSDDFKIKISDKCCFKLKKEPIQEWMKENNKPITITGMRKAEGGLRNNINCIITDKNNNVLKFHPLSVVNDEWCDWFIKEHKINLCRLYYPPFNFKRTGCKGCPFNIKLQESLNIMEKYLPKEKEQCELIWKPVYDEYRRIGYRLKK